MMTPRATYESELLKLLERNPALMVLTAENRAAIRNLPRSIGGRFIDFGICEQTMIGAAAGLALRGRIPVVHALAAFLTMRAFEFIRTDIGIAGLPVKLVGAVPGLLSDGNGPTHQALEDIALMRGIPGMRVFSPADLEDLLIGLPCVLADPHPWYIRYNPTPSLYHHTRQFSVGRAELCSEGTDVALVTHGYLFGEAVKAKLMLEQEGVSVRLINMRTITPIDEQALVDALLTTEVIVTLEDHFLTGGLYSVLSELFTSYAYSATVIPIAFSNRWFRPGRLPEVLDIEGMTGRHIADTIIGALRGERAVGAHAMPTPIEDQDSN